jgi:hypothetical protein
MNLQLAAVAGAGIDLADRQAATEPAARRASGPGDGSVSGRCSRLSNRIRRI